MRARPCSGKSEGSDAHGVLQVGDQMIDSVGVLHAMAGSFRLDLLKADVAALNSVSQTGEWATIRFDAVRYVKQ
jgi:hypothetical protein